MDFGRSVIVGSMLAIGCAGVQSNARMAVAPRCAVAQAVDPMPDNQRGTQPRLADAGKVVSASGGAARGNAKIPADAPQAIAPVDPQAARGNPSDGCMPDRRYAHR